VAPVLIAVLWIVGGSTYAVSGAIGLGMTTLGLAVLTAIAFGLQQLDIVNFTVTGITLICSHLVLVLWEAARAYPAKPVTADDAVRS
jgi:hypothetical protein